MRDPRKDLDWPELEPGRYELYDGPAAGSDPTRRDLWRILGAGALFVFTDSAPGSSTGELLSTRFHLGENGVVTLLTGKVEIGQGARTELTQVVAEELGVEPARVRVIMGDTALVPDDGGTWASLTTPQTVPLVRRAAAAVRAVLPDLKAGDKIPGVVPDEIDVTDPSRWKVCGTPVPNVKGRDIVTGAHRFSCDQRSAGMLHGRVKRSGGHRPHLESADAAEAARLPGVRVVRDGDLVGVTAPDRAAAGQAIDQVSARWRFDPLVEASQLAAHFKKTAREPVHRPAARYPPLIEEGSVDEGLAQSAHRHESSYFVNYIAHVPLEPRSALATWNDDGSVTVRTGTQVPFGARREIARAFQLTEEKVRIITAEVGAGFGGKHRAECQLEAARLARGAGKPVMLEWSREEEFTCSYARPAGLIEVRSGVSEEGRLLAWDFHNYNSGAAGLRAPYRIPHHYCGFHRADSPLRQGSYRALAATANTFAREMHIGELAARLDSDPLDFRLRNLAAERTRAVLERAAERFHWGQGKGGAGRGFGLACNVEKGAHLALCVELETGGGRGSLRRVVVAVDCGAIINPENIENQITGAVIQGIGGALFEQLHYDRRGIRGASLAAYRVPRFSDVPEIEVILVDRRDQPSAGIGESPITVIAPAIGAALHDATGEWRRSLPFFPNPS